jgi:hypothetical protein
MDEQKNVFFIPEANQSGFLSEIARLSRRAVKMGFAPFAPILFDDSERTTDKGWTYRVFHYTFEAKPPCIKGWIFSATIDHSNEAGNIIRRVLNTGVALPIRFRHAEPVCEHCGTRRYRRDTFVLYCPETDEFKQVGRSCLQDFFGHDPMAAARYAEILAAAGECGEAMEEFDFASGRNFINLRDFLANAAAMVREHGWISRKKATEEGTTGTADMAMSNMYSKGSRHYVSPTTDDRTIVEQAIEWGLNLSNKRNMTDYDHNVMVVVGSSVITPKTAGIAASVIGVYLMHRDRQAAEQAARAAGGASAYVGAVKERLRAMDATVTGAFPINVDMGVLYIYTFSVNGNVFKWFTAGRDDLTVGARIKLTGTVKKHEEYKGVKQTSLSRCVIESAA